MERLAPCSTHSLLSAPLIAILLAYMHKPPSTCKKQTQHVLCSSLAALAISKPVVCICHDLILRSLHRFLHCFRVLHPTILHRLLLSVIQLVALLFSAKIASLAHAHCYQCTCMPKFSQPTCEVHAAGNASISTRVVSSSGLDLGR